jgi:hypothetical protein
VECGDSIYTYELGVSRGNPNFPLPAVLAINR